MSSTERKFLQYQAPPALWDKLKPLAREMRHAPTAAEHILWQRLRNRGVGSAKFRRQYSIERFIVDFICLNERLVIEVDGEVHRYTVSEDALRQEFLEALGLRVLRFANHDVIHDLDTVIDVIEHAVQQQNAHYKPAKRKSE